MYCGCCQLQADRSLVPSGPRWLLGAFDWLLSGLRQIPLGKDIRIQPGGRQTLASGSPGRPALSTARIATTRYCMYLSERDIPFEGKISHER